MRGAYAARLNTARLPEAGTSFRPKLADIPHPELTNESKLPE